MCCGGGGGGGGEGHGGDDHYVDQNQEVSQEHFKLFKINCIHDPGDVTILIFIFLSTFFGSLSPILYVKSHLNFDQEKILLARPVWVEVTAQMSDKFCKKPLMVDKPSPMGLLESLQPVGMGSKTIFSTP